MERQSDGRLSKAENKQDIAVAAHSLKWKWGGNVARMYQRRWARAASVWGLRVGPMADTFQRVAGGHWSRTVIIRSEWSRYTKWSYNNSANIIRKWLHNYTGVFTDTSVNLPDRIETLLHVPKRQWDIAMHSWTSDKTLQISMVPPGIRCPRRIN